MCDFTAAAECEGVTVLFPDQSLETEQEKSNTDIQSTNIALILTGKMGIISLSQQS